MNDSCQANKSTVWSVRIDGGDPIAVVSDYGEPSYWIKNRDWTSCFFHVDADHVLSFATMITRRRVHSRMNTAKFLFENSSKKRQEFVGVVESVEIIHGVAHFPNGLASITLSGGNLFLKNLARLEEHARDANFLVPVVETSPLLRSGKLKELAELRREHVKSLLMTRKASLKVVDQGNTLSRLKADLQDLQSYLDRVCSAVAVDLKWIERIDTNMRQDSDKQAQKKTQASLKVAECLDELNNLQSMQNEQRELVAKLSSPGEKDRVNLSEKLRITDNRINAKKIGLYIQQTSAAELESDVAQIANLLIKNERVLSLVLAHCTSLYCELQKLFAECNAHSLTIGTFNAPQNSESLLSLNGNLAAQIKAKIDDLQTRYTALNRAIDVKLASRSTIRKCEIDEGEYHSSSAGGGLPVRRQLLRLEKLAENVFALERSAEGKVSHGIGIANGSAFATTFGSAPAIYIGQGVHYVGRSAPSEYSWQEALWRSEFGEPRVKEYPDPTGNFCGTYNTIIQAQQQFVEGTLEIETYSQSYIVRWRYPDGSMVEGMGIPLGNYMCATYQIESLRGILLYRRNDDGSLDGERSEIGFAQTFAERALPTHFFIPDDPPK